MANSVIKNQASGLTNSLLGTISIIDSTIEDYEFLRSGFLLTSTILNI
jgi:hypothetical protein